MRELTIGAVARISGVRASAIRYYESEGLIPRAARRGGQRVYSAAILDHLAFIRLAKLSGFGIAEIRLLVSGFSRSTRPGERWRAVAEGKLRALDRQIAELRRMKKILAQLTQCDCPTLEVCGRALRQTKPSNAPA